MILMRPAEGVMEPPLTIREEEIARIMETIAAAARAMD